MPTGPFGTDEQDQLTHLEKFSVNFSSSSFVICANLPYPLPFLFLHGLLVSLKLVFFDLSEQLCSG